MNIKMKTPITIDEKIAFWQRQVGILKCLKRESDQRWAQAQLQYLVQVKFGLVNAPLKSKATREQ